MSSAMSKGYTYQGTVQVGKFSVMVADSSISNDGMLLPAGQNVRALGIIQDGIVPENFSEYVKGSYGGVSQAAWPANALPSSPQGVFKRPLIYAGVSKARAAGAIGRDDWLVVADTDGRVGSIVTLAIAGGTLVHIVGRADEPAVNAEDVLRIYVDIHDRHV